MRVIWLLAMGMQEFIVEAVDNIVGRWSESPPWKEAERVTYHFLLERTAPLLPSGLKIQRF